MPGLAATQLHCCSQPLPVPTSASGVPPNSAILGLVHVAHAKIVFDMVQGCLGFGPRLQPAGISGIASAGRPGMSMLCLNYLPLHIRRSSLLVVAVVCWCLRPALAVLQASQTSSLSHISKVNLNLLSAS